MNSAAPSRLSKRVAIADAPQFVADFATTGAVGDKEAFYELAKLADDNADEAQRLIAGYEHGGNLRARLKAARRPASENPESDPDDEAPRGQRTLAGRGRGEPNLARAGRGARGGGERDEDEEVSHSKLSKPAKPARVEAFQRRGTQIVFVTEEGKLHFEFSATAKKQLLKILNA